MCLLPSGSSLVARLGHGHHEISMCDTLTASALRFSTDDTWPSSAAALSLWAVAFFHVFFFAAAVWRDVQMRQEGWLKEEYFLTRDAAHAQVLKLSLASRLRAVGCGAWSAMRKNEAVKSLARWLAIFCVRAAAAVRLRLSELDVQFMLLHMYQVTFANEESAWTRKRNSDFLALQLKVQQAISAAYSDLVPRPSLQRRFCIFFVQFQPHWSVQSYSMVTRCFMRACLVVANIFGRVALSVICFLVIGDTRARSTVSCTPSGSKRQYVEGVIGGIGIQLLFSFISRLLQLIWTAVLLLFHSREFKQDVEWDAKSRQKQVNKWWLQDIAFAVLMSLYSLACCLLGTAYIASASDEDGQRWLTSFATMVILTVLVEPLTKSLLAAGLAGKSMQETGGIGLQDCLGLHHGPAGVDLQPIREVEEAPRAPECALPNRSPSAPALNSTKDTKEPDLSPVASAGLGSSANDINGSNGLPAIHAWKSSPMIPMEVGRSNPRGQRESWRRQSNPSVDANDADGAAPARQR